MRAGVIECKSKKLLSFYFLNKSIESNKETNLSFSLVILEILVDWEFQIYDMFFQNI